MRLARRDFLGLAAAASAAHLVPARCWGRFNGEGLCERLKSDVLRPQYHLLPASNWMNDPNGPIFFKGRYHMFHQYNPGAAVWGNMSWAHATSPDMVFWEHEPIALTPTPGGHDRDGVFSGSAIEDKGKVFVIYTGVMPPGKSSEATLKDGQHTWRETQLLAEAQDEMLREWKKRAAPVIATPPTAMKVTGFRDPFVWREGDEWLLALGSGTREKGGAVLLYSSPDLLEWKYLHPLVEAIRASGSDSTNPVDCGDMWECPDFFPLGDKHVLLVSTEGKVRWKVGSYRDRRFTPEREGVTDFGSFYAAKTMLDANGRRILWGWVPETRPEREYSAAGWAGVMALPRVLTLNSSNELVSMPLPVLEKLRGKRVEFRPGDPDKMKQAQVQDLAAEILVKGITGPTFELSLQPGGGKFATVRVDLGSGARMQAGNVTAPLRPGSDGSLDLHIFLDGSVMEIFANGTALTTRVYEPAHDALRVSPSGDSTFKNLTVWQMKSISANRLTSPLC